MVQNQSSKCRTPFPFKGRVHRCCEPHLLISNQVRFLRGHATLATFAARFLPPGTVVALSAAPSTVGGRLSSTTSDACSAPPSQRVPRFARAQKPLRAIRILAARSPRLPLIYVLANARIATSVAIMGTVAGARLFGFCARFLAARRALLHGVEPCVAHKKSHNLIGRGFPARSFCSRECWEHIVSGVS